LRRASIRRNSQDARPNLAEDDPFLAPADGGPALKPTINRDRCPAIQSNSFDSVVRYRPKNNRPSVGREGEVDNQSLTFRSRDGCRFKSRYGSTVQPGIRGVHKLRAVR